MFEKPNLKPAFWGPIFEAMFDHRSAPPSPETTNKIMDLNRGTNCTAYRSACTTKYIRCLPMNQVLHFQQLFWLLSERASKAFLSVWTAPSPRQLYLHGSY